MNLFLKLDLREDDMKFEAERKQRLEKARTYFLRAKARGVKFKERQLLRFDQAYPTPFLKTFSDLLHWKYDLSFQINSDETDLEDIDIMTEMVYRKNPFLKIFPKEDNAFSGSYMPILIHFGEKK